MIGKTVQHYKIVEKLGQGGMGEVWKAQDTRLDRFVALKFLPESADDDSMVERFLREARAASALNHPGICTIHDIGEWQGQRYIVMEHLEGMTLRKMASAGALDIEAIVETGIQLSDALDAAHSKNIIHRDIKSSNIVLSPRGQAKILDFGLAKIVQTEEHAQEDTSAGDETVAWKPDLTDDGQAVGTVSYMSPEQALGKDVDTRTDLFSLGVVLYEMSTGRQAFGGSTSAAIFDEILHKTPVSPVTLNRNLPVDLERIINKALEKDRDLRYQSAAELLTDLKRLRRDSSSQSVAAAQPARAQGGRRAMLVVAAVAMAAAFAVIMKQINSEDPVRTAGPVRTSPLTSLGGVEEGGSWSPDGNYFTFSHSAQGPADIYVMSSAGGDAIHLVESEYDDMDPRWSPTNEWIAFASGRDSKQAIYLVPPLGGQIQHLVDIGPRSLSTASGLGSQPWSPDGRFLLYPKRTEEGLCIWKIDTASRVETKITNVEGDDWHSDASWSFDGERIAFSHYHSSGSSILAMPSTGGEPTLAIPGEGRGVIPGGRPVHSNPVWAPDSRHLVFTEFDQGVGRQAFWLARVGHATPVNLIQSAGTLVGSPAISSTGRLLYNSYSHQTDLYIQVVETGEQQRLTSHSRDNFVPQFSPDGTQVAYMSTRTGETLVWVLNIETGNEYKLPQTAAHRGWPTWSRDGEEIAFLSARVSPTGAVGLGAIWMGKATGGPGSRLTEQSASGPIQFSPSGNLVGFISWIEGTPEFWVWDRETKQERKVMDNVAYYDWYRDDDHIIATMHSQSDVGEMRAIQLSTQESSLLLSEHHQELTVTEDGSAVSYCTSKSHYNMNLHVLRLEATPSGLPRPAGPPEKITHGDGEWHVHNGDWSPDGKQVIYTRDTDSADLFVMDGVFEASGKQ